MNESVLDDPVGESLRGAHSHLARRHGTALRYPDDVSTFVAVPVNPRPQDWDDLAGLLGGGGFADLFSAEATPPDGWPPEFDLDGFQMIGTAAHYATYPDVLTLGPADVPDMLALVEQNQPGPFWARTIAMGTYVGIRDTEGRLVAMAGERLHPPGWIEISAVCTAPEARGKGCATRLVSETAARIVSRGERPLIHVAAANRTAQAIYSKLGFETRREVTFRGFKVPTD
ncbi:GNAT family N-acetyltransferase [Kineosporia succinea]|uniref:Ribosomal protein S18 acetylase RimI-like enzyme n=1 Tax=Kineosporia succinea TaxID=84632 RepID=A0ABT9P3Y9_9ACTN|nr:GNAT family N-acetyltransferase [Kineosporia succinea]MDP9827393.1 ribosomal protein S18 acetylase RimI-like enzyme [Kineosporia succinea]